MTTTIKMRIAIFSIGRVECMKLYIIETKELKRVSPEWKQVAVSNVLAENSYKALTIVSQQYPSDQHSHKVVSSIEVKDKIVIRSFFSQ